MVEQASDLSYFIMTFTHPPNAGRTSGSRKSSSSSGSSSVPISAKKTRQKRWLSDEDVWEWPDSKIIGKLADLDIRICLTFHYTATSQKTWKSLVYSHYNVSLDRCDETRTLTFRFTYRVNPDGHPPLTRHRLDTSQGTSNLERARRKCNQDRGEDDHTSSGTPAAPPPPTYSVAKHCALIAAHCASSRRPFNSVSDPHYVQEVQMLCPEAKIPSPSTVSRDVFAMYEHGAGVVRKYFSVCNPPLASISCMPNRFTGA